MIVPPKNLAKDLGVDKPLLKADTLRELFESYEIVKDILDSTDKAALWFYVNNPHLGNVAPINFFLMGRGHKVLKFVQNAKDENFPQDTP